MPPRFSVVSTAPKCKVCNTTVYPQERVDYDQGTWHQTCFKCLECRSTLTMAAVAMINGQAYCKTCFKKIFLREGKYSSFENRGSASSPPPASSPSPTPASATAAAAAATITDSGSSDAVADTSIAETKESSDSNDTGATSASTATTEAAAPNIPKTFDTPALALKDAIVTKNRDGIRQLIDVNGIDIIFEPNEKGLSPLETTLGHYEQKHMGVLMLDVLRSQIAAANKLFAENNIPSPFAAK